MKLQIPFKTREAYNISFSFLKFGQFLKKKKFFCGVHVFLFPELQRACLLDRQEEWENCGWCNGLEIIKIVSLSV